MKPVYAGTTIGVRFTCKEKTPLDLKDENDIPKGIVKWYVDVYDETGESVMIATILTMVRKNIKYAGTKPRLCKIRENMGKPFTLNSFHPQQFPAEGIAE